MEQDRSYPEDALPGETAHETAVRVKYGLGFCLWCGWPVLIEALDRHRICRWCRSAATDIDHQ